MKSKIRILGLSLLIAACTSVSLHAQETGRKSGAVKTAEKVNKKSVELQDASNQVLNESQQAANNVQQTVNNAKSVIKVFEPILRFMLRKKSSTETTTVSDPVNQTNQNQEVQVPVATNEPVQEATPAYFDSGITYTDVAQGTVMTENAGYNIDGSANLGSQNNKTYGCYLDMKQGLVMDEIDVAGNSKSVDLIFTATGSFNEQVPMYAFLTPSYASRDGAAYHFFKGVKYKDKDIPPATWEEVNESEVAMTSLTGAQFEKIRDNNQLMAVVKQVKGFSQKVESRTKLEGKVLAVKTEMGDRTAYGLIYIQSHFGTTGENGYLKVKIKVTGFDGNGDGVADVNLY